MAFPEPAPEWAPVVPNAWTQDFKPSATAAESSGGYMPEQFTAARRQAPRDESGAKQSSTKGYTQEQVMGSQRGASQDGSTVKNTSTAAGTARISANAPADATSSTGTYANTTSEDTTAATAPVAERPAPPIIHEIDMGPVQPIRLPPMYNEAWSPRNDTG